MTRFEKDPGILNNRPYPGRCARNGKRQGPYQIVTALVDMRPKVAKRDRAQQKVNFKEWYAKSRRS